MKNVKFIFPTFAFLFAIGLAFSTTISVNGNSFASQSCSLPPPSDCQKIGTCTLGGSTLCQTPDLVTVVVFFTASGTCGGAFDGSWDASFD